MFLENLGQRIARQIRERRKKARLSQLRLAERADVSLNEISLIERGQRLPRLGTVERVARALGVDAGELCQR